MHQATQSKEEHVEINEDKDTPPRQATKASIDKHTVDIKPDIKPTRKKKSGPIEDKKESFDWQAMGVIGFSHQI